MTVNIAVFAPMPSARTRMAVAANNGFFRMPAGRVDGVLPDGFENSGDVHAISLAAPMKAGLI